MSVPIDAILPQLCDFRHWRETFYTVHGTSMPQRFIAALGACFQSQIYMWIQDIATEQCVLAARGIRFSHGICEPVTTLRCAHAACGASVASSLSHERMVRFKYLPESNNCAAIELWHCQRGYSVLKAAKDRRTDAQAVSYTVRVIPRQGLNAFCQTFSDRLSSSRVDLSVSTIEIRVFCFKSINSAWDSWPGCANECL